MDDLSEQLISLGVGCNRDKDKFHIYAIGKSNIKVFFTEEGFSEDINERVETDDIVLAVQTVQELIESENSRIELSNSIKGK